MNWHPYRDGFSVLPALKKVPVDAAFRPDRAHHDWVMGQKWAATCAHSCQAESDCSQEVYAAACAFLEAHYPLPLYGPFAVLGGWTGPWTFASLARQIQEDLVVHRVEGSRDWVAAVHAAFPSGWTPAGVVGRSLDELHAPVPGMARGNGRKLAEAMVRSGPFERFVWSVLFEPTLDTHPSRPRAKFDPEAPDVWVKVERQVTVPLPEVNASLFVLRQHLVGGHQLDRQALAAAIESMTAEQRTYKGLGECSEGVIDFLRNPRGEVGLAA